MFYLDLKGDDSLYWVELNGISSSTYNRSLMLSAKVLVSNFCLITESNKDRQWV